MNGPGNATGKCPMFVAITWDDGIQTQRTLAWWDKRVPANR